MIERLILSHMYFVSSELPIIGEGISDVNLSSQTLFKLRWPAVIGRRDSTPLLPDVKRFREIRINYFGSILNNLNPGPE